MVLKTTAQLAGRLSRRNRRKSSQMRGGRSAAFHGILKNTLREPRASGQHSDPVGINCEGLWLSFSVHLFHLML